MALFLIASLVVSGWRNPKSRAWLADSLWFLVPLVPTLNILDIDAIARASDRFLYWPLMGVCALLTRVMAVALARAVWARRAAVVIAAATSVSFVGATALHVSHFRTDYTLWGHEYEVDQGNTEALWALAGIAKYEGLSESAHALCTEGFRAAEARHYRWTSIRFALCQLETSLDLAIPSDPETVIYVREVYDELMDKSLLLADRGSLKFDMHITSKIITDRLMANPESVALPRARAAFGVRQHRSGYRTARTDHAILSKPREPVGRCSSTRTERRATSTERRRPRREHDSCLERNGSGRTMQPSRTRSLLLLWAIVLAVFGIGLRGAFVWDDFSLIVNNANLRDASHLGELLTTGFWNNLLFEGATQRNVRADLSADHDARAVRTAPAIRSRCPRLPRCEPPPAPDHRVLGVRCAAAALGRRSRWLARSGGRYRPLCHSPVTRAERRRVGICLDRPLDGVVRVRRIRGLGQAPHKRDSAGRVLFGLALFAKETAIVIPAVLWIDMYARRGTVNWRRWGASTAVFSIVRRDSLRHHAASSDGYRLVRISTTGARHAWSLRRGHGLALAPFRGARFSVQQL